MKKTTVGLPAFALSLLVCVHASAGGWQKAARPGAAQGGSGTVVLAVSKYESNVTTEPVVIYRGGAYVKPPTDDVPVWSIICVVVRGGHRKQGVTRHLVEGAVAYAASQGAPAVEAYPVDPAGRMDTTMAFVGTRAMFAGCGFEVVGQTDAVASKMPRLVMRRTLG